MKSLGTQRRKKEFTEVGLMRREERGKREGACPLAPPPPNFPTEISRYVRLLNYYKLPLLTKMNVTCITGESV